MLAVWRHNGHEGQIEMLLNGPARPALHAIRPRSPRRAPASVLRQWKKPPSWEGGTAWGRYRQHRASFPAAPRPLRATALAVLCPPCRKPPGPCARRSICSRRRGAGQARRPDRRCMPRPPASPDHEFRLASTSRALRAAAASLPASRDRISGTLVRTAAFGWPRTTETTCVAWSPLRAGELQRASAAARTDPSASLTSCCPAPQPTRDRFLSVGALLSLLVASWATRPRICGGGRRGRLI